MQLLLCTFLVASSKFHLKPFIFQTFETFSYFHRVRRRFNKAHSGRNLPEFHRSPIQMGNHAVINKSNIWLHTVYVQAMTWHHLPEPSANVSVVTFTLLLVLPSTHNALPNSASHFKSKRLINLPWQLQPGSVHFLFHLQTHSQDLLSVSSN